MKNYKRLMVGIAFSEADKSTIRYAAMISRLSKSEKVIFVYLLRESELIESFQRESPQLLGPVDEFAKKQMETRVGEYFDGHPATVKEYVVVEGSPALDLPRLCKEHNSDLLIIGKSPSCDKEVKLPVKIARKVPCSVIVVPSDIKAEIKNVLVPVDFSDNSKTALEVGIRLAAAAGVTSVKCVNVFSVPAGFREYGKSDEELAENMKGHAKKYAAQFLEQVEDRGVSLVPLFTFADDVIEGIKKTIIEHQIDTVVVGARGVESIANLLLGSVTRGLIRSTSITVVAVKKKPFVG